MTKNTIATTSATAMVAMPTARETAPNIVPAMEIADAAAVSEVPPNQLSISEPKPK